MGLKAVLSDDEIYEITVDDHRYSEIYISLKELERSIILLHSNVLTIVGTCTVKVAYHMDSIAKEHFADITYEL
jgi:hypothetical protein